MAQIFELTPRQFQLLSARASERVYNGRQFDVALAGGKPDFIDDEAEKAMAKAAQKHKDDAQGDYRDIVEETLNKKQAENKEHGKS